MANYRSRLTTLLEFDSSQTDWRDALRGALVTAIITLPFVLNGDLTKIIPLTIGAVFVAIAEAGQPFGDRWRTMLWTTAILMLAVTAGSALSNLTVMAVIASGLVALVGGAVGFLGRRAAVGGLLGLVLFVIYVGVPVSLDDAFISGALVGLGGVIQTIAAVTMGVIRKQHRLPRSDIKPRPALSDLWKGNHTFLSHGIRLAIVIMIATSISESISLPHPYWLPMSVAWMSKPDNDGTVVRIVHRLVGTIVGLLFVLLLVVVFQPDGTSFLPIALVGAAVAIAFIWANYAIAVAGVTVWVVALFGMVGDPVVETMGLRFLATVAAAALVLIATWVFDWRPRRAA
jgi:MFS family permease